MKRLNCSRLFLFVGVFVVLSVNSVHNSRLLLIVFRDSATAAAAISVEQRVTNATTATSAAESEARDNRPLCKRDQLRDGQWLPIALEAGPPYIPRAKFLQCQIPNYNYSDPGPWHTYDWKPHDSSCQLSRWDPTDFCDLLPFGTVSIMGDSLSWEQYSSLLQLLGQRVHQTDQHKSKYEQSNHVQLACRQTVVNTGNFHSQPSTTKFVFRNDARLTPQSVSDSINQDFPLVLIMNRGAHYRNDTELVSGIRLLLPVLADWQAKCRRLGLKCHFYWRTTVPGHHNCANFTEPVNDLTAMEKHVESPATYTDEKFNTSNSWNYHWYSFQHQNKLILRELALYADSHSDFDYNVMDAYELNVLRPDGHRTQSGDCLHNCYPGKMDLYNQLLLHFLKMHRSKDDVQHMVRQYEMYIERAKMAAANLSKVVL